MAKEQPASAGFMETFKKKLDDIRQTIEEDPYRKKVLSLCQQLEPRSFEEYSCGGSFRKLEKLESSTYSEVLKAIDLLDNKPIVMKIMRALSKGVIRKLPPAATSGCQAYKDIYNELVVTQALSRLHHGVAPESRPKCLYRTHFFCFIQEIKVVSGSLDRTLSKSKCADPKPKSKDLEREENATNERSADDAKDKSKTKDDDNKRLSEDDRMLREALPYEYVVSVMRHDGQPLWWMMTHKKLTPEQMSSVLVQVIVGLAIAESVYMYEHRDLHVSNILIKKVSEPSIPFVLNNNHYNIMSHGIKATIIDATFSRLSINGTIHHRDLTSTLDSFGRGKTPTRMSLQDRSYRQMVHLTNNNWEIFNPKTNLIWLTYLCETLMKNEVMKSNQKLHSEIRKIRDHTIKAKNTLELLGYFPCKTSSNGEKETIAKVLSSIPDNDDNLSNSLSQVYGNLDKRDSSLDKNSQKSLKSPE